MHRLRVVFRGISHKPIVFSRYTHKPFAIENTVANTINATCALRMMGRLDVIPSNIRLSCVVIGCTFYDMSRESPFIAGGIADHSARFSPFCNPVGAS